jgi:hypothetical protein
MFQRIALLATCVVLAAIFVTSVGCGQAGLGPIGTTTATAGSSGTVSGFPFIEIGKKYSAIGNPFIVKKDLGGGWVLVETSVTGLPHDQYFVNLNALPAVVPGI